MHNLSGAIASQEFDLAGLQTAYFSSYTPAYIHSTATQAAAMYIFGCKKQKCSGQRRHGSGQLVELALLEVLEQLLLQDLGHRLGVAGVNLAGPGQLAHPAYES